MKRVFYVDNRQRLLEQLAPNSIVIMSGHTSIQRGNDASFAFEQESSFWYLTGIDAPDWWVIIDAVKSWLVAPEIDDMHQIFEGGLTRDEVEAVSGVDAVISRSEAKSLIETLAKSHDQVYTIGKDPHAQHYSFIINPACAQMNAKLEKVFREVLDCRLDLARLRSIKQSVEIDAMQHSIDLTVDTFSSVKENLKNLHTEYELEAEFTYAFRRSGATGHAYDPIVASAGHACTLHYGLNQDELPANGLVLIDIGARVDGYAADITRTYAIGTPTERQIAVHQAVERAHHEVIGLLRPGLNVREYHERVDDIMKRELIALRLMKDVDDPMYRTYFPHAISHGLGIDVHDSLGRPETFQPGMVLTVEPGIYIPSEGIGVRIEDDILITDTGHLNLSAALPTSL